MESNWPSPLHLLLHLWREPQGTLTNLQQSEGDQAAGSSVSAYHTVSGGSNMYGCVLLIRLLEEVMFPFRINLADRNSELLPPPAVVTVPSADIRPSELWVCCNARRYRIDPAAFVMCVCGHSSDVASYTAGEMNREKSATKRNKVCGNDLCCNLSRLKCDVNEVNIATVPERP